MSAYFDIKSHFTVLVLYSYAEKHYMSSKMLLSLLMSYTERLIFKLS